MKTTKKNQAIGEIYSYEGGTESEVVKLTFDIRKKELLKLSPIKQGDLFGIQNLSNER